jgi:hypothetical protein
LELNFGLPLDSNNVVYRGPASLLNGVHYTPLGMAMGAFGASRSVYSHFLSRGQDVVFPKDTAMEIGFGRMITPPSGHAIQQ